MITNRDIFCVAQRELGLTYLFISHDLAVVRDLSTQIGVMYLGKLVEVGPADLVYGSPAHPYTKGLIDSAPVADPLAEKAKVRAGSPGSCPARFHRPRAAGSGPGARSRRTDTRKMEPLLRGFGPGHLAACHYPLIAPAPDTAPAAAAGPPGDGDRPELA